MRIDRLQKRCIQLRALSSAVEEITRQIRYTNHELKQILSSLEGNDIKHLPFLSVDNFQSEILLTDAFKTTSGLLFNAEEKGAVRDFLKSFGTTDRADQLCQCDRLISFLTQRISYEQSRLPQQIRVTATLSFCVGTALVLILL